MVSVPQAALKKSLWVRVRSSVYLYFSQVLRRWSTVTLVLSVPLRACVGGLYQLETRDMLCILGSGVLVSDLREIRHAGSKEGV